jgi:hypothetical protein
LFIRLYCQYLYMDRRSWSESFFRKPHLHFNIQFDSIYFIHGYVNSSSSLCTNFLVKALNVFFKTSFKNNSKWNKKSVKTSLHCFPEYHWHLLWLYQ